MPENQNKVARPPNLDLPWRAAIGLAWEAHRSGNIGIGAVLTDPAGAIVAQGRNRVCDRDAPPGRMRSTPVAHAEIDVLGQLSPGNYRHHTLWSTLEPCPLCSTAIVMSKVGIVRFAAADRLWDGISRLADVSDFIAERWPHRSGPLIGPVASFCELLPILWFLKNKPNGTVVDCYGERHPELLDIARRVGADGTLDRLADHSADAVLNAMWSDLGEIDRR